MDILTSPPTVMSGPTPPQQPQGAAAQLTSDFEVFLKMLTAQMKYQDPLNPVDSTDYATQLATFSGVEQAVQTNDLLRNLTTQLGVGGLGELANWVGREVRANAPVAYTGDPVRLYPRTTAFADQWEVSIRNANGQEVQRLPLPAGQESILWSGAQAGGTFAPQGTYTVVALGKINGQIVAEAPVETYTRVREVRIEDGNRLLVVEGGTKLAIDDVTALREG